MGTPYRDLIGFENENVKIIGFSHYDKGHKSYWHTQCKHCGRTWTPRGSHVVSASYKSCGCKRVESARQKNFRGVGELSGAAWGRIKFNAKARGHAVGIQIQDAYNLFAEQGGRCALSGERITLDGSDRTASLDRIDSNGGYEIGNIQWIHKDLNKMKNTFSQKDFLAWINKVHSYNFSN